MLGSRESHHREDDLLASQFNLTGMRTGPLPKLTSRAELEMATASNYECLSKEASIRNSILPTALLELHKNGRIRLQENQLKPARDTLIARCRSAHEKGSQEFGDLRSRLAEINGSGLLADSEIDKGMRRYELDRLDSVYTLSHPEVVELALREAYDAGYFSGQEKEIQACIEVHLRRKALNMATEEPDQQVRMASSNGIFAQNF